MINIYVATLRMWFGGQILSPADELSRKIGSQSKVLSPRAVRGASKQSDKTDRASYLMNELKRLAPNAKPWNEDLLGVPFKEQLGAWEDVSSFLSWIRSASLERGFSCKHASAFCDFYLPCGIELSRIELPSEEMSWSIGDTEVLLGELNNAARALELKKQWTELARGEYVSDPADPLIRTKTVAAIWRSGAIASVHSRLPLIIG